MWIVVSHVEGDAEFVSRFTLTVRREDVYLTLEASCERGYPVVKGNCFINKHDERGDEVVPQLGAVRHNSFAKLPTSWRSGYREVQNQLHPFALFT